MVGSGLLTWSDMSYRMAPCVTLIVRCFFNQSSRRSGVLIGHSGMEFGVVAAV
jgi:hypothetical protein